jgi:hypothetical protein
MLLDLVVSEEQILYLYLYIYLYLYLKDDACILLK